MTSSRAAVLTGRESFEVRSTPLPAVGDEDAILRIEACGICGSDIRQYRNQLPSSFYPIIPGHEPVGIIEAIGHAASTRWRVKVGDRVGVEAGLRCGSCRSCQRGLSLGCTADRLDTPVHSYGAIPMSVAPSLWGGFAEFMYLDRDSHLHGLPSELPIEEAALLNALANAVDWSVLIPSTAPNASAVVLGPGQRGLLSVVALRDAGAGTIIVTGLRRDRHKLEVALALGADHVICVEDDDPVRRVHDMTGGELVDLVVDTTPAATRPILDAVEMAAPGGTVVLGGLKGGAPVEGLDTDRIARKQLTIRGVLGAGSQAFATAARILASRARPVGLVHSHTFGLAGASDAIRTLAGEGDPAIAVMLAP